MPDFIANPDWDQNLIQLKAIIGGMVEGVVAFDREGKIYFANKMAMNLYDLSRAELRRNARELNALFEFHDLDGELLPEAAHPTLRLLRGESFRDYRIWSNRKGSDRRWLGLYNGAQVDDTVLLCVQSVRDVTAQYELEARHKATFAVNPTAMSIVRLADLRFTEVNESFLRLTAYDRGEVIGQTADQLQLHIEREKRKIAVRRMRSSEEDRIIEYEDVLRTKTGEYRTVLSEGRVIRFDGVAYLIDTYVDISERKRTENELSQTIQAVMNDPSWFVRVLQEKLVEIRSGQVPRPGLELLSPREQEVLGGVAKGLNNEQIAQNLGLKTQTVRNYISTIYEKIDVHSRGEAIIWARERGLIFSN